SKAQWDGPRGREGPGRRRGPRCAPWARPRPSQRRLGARRPPTTRLALTWVISLGGDIYRVGARQGATPPSTPVHEVDPGDTHIYSQSRPLSLPPPPPGDTVACGRPTSQVVGTLARA